MPRNRVLYQKTSNPINLVLVFNVKMTKYGQGIHPHPILYIKFIFDKLLNYEHCQRPQL